jgi:apolipoprotein N-acyltransferase
MSVRELLQTEIWSKRTSRKIWVGIGIVFGIAAVGFGTLYLVERHWLTSGEREAGKAALVQIDALQNFDLISDEDFDARAKQAEEKVEAAKQAALTIRDERVADILYVYVSGIETEQGDVKLRKLMQQKRIATTGAQQELADSISSSGKEVTQFARSVLHKALDK